MVGVEVERSLPTHPLAEDGALGLQLAVDRRRPDLPTVLCENKPLWLFMLLIRVSDQNNYYNQYFFKLCQSKKQTHCILFKEVV